MSQLEGRPSWVPEGMFPFESRFRTIDGCKVHFVDEGTGPVLLFLHGNPTWSFLYRNIIRRLSDSFRCIALDLPGFGLSTARDDYGFTAAEHAGIVEGFVEDLDLRDVTLMGQDWGGPIGLTVATRHPERFAGFVLGNTWAWPLNGIPHFEIFGRLMGGPLGRAMIRNANAFVNVMIPMGTASKVPGPVMEAYRGPFATRPARRPTWEFPQELLRSRHFLTELEGNLGKVSHLPTLFLWGGGDFALRAKVELKRFQGVLPNHHTVVLDRARHFFQEDAPDRAASEIRSWMHGRARAARPPHKVSAG
jgi:haloalkane dehalogenase